MKTVVIMPGGFHPFHAGHYALYQQAQKAFPGAEVFVAATDDRATRPFPFAVKEKLAQLAGVDASHFVRVTSPFQAREITANFDPAEDQVIFVRSQKDANEPPRPGGTKKDGSPSYLQPYTGKDMQPFGRHAYMTYLPVVEFGPGMTSATQIRAAWPSLNDRRKLALVMSLYPKTQNNTKLANTVVKMLDTVIMGVAEAVKPVAPTVPQQPTQQQPKQNTYVAPAKKKSPAAIIHIERQPKQTQEDQDYVEEKWSQKYKRSINCNNPRGFSQRAHCQGRRKK